MLYFIIYLPKLWLRFLLTTPDGADSQERYTIESDRWLNLQSHDSFPLKHIKKQIIKLQTMNYIWNKYIF